MATYKVPQDVEADDKLIGPFSFRQFIYLVIVVLAGAAAWGLAQIFIGLAVIPLPVIILFGALALPLRKDQPMETYLAAMVSFYLKPHRRLWDPDGVESMIEITVPKTVEVHLTKDISQEDADQRFAYLANIVDSQGWAIRGAGAAPGAMNNDVFLEAQGAPDMLDSAGSLGQNFDTMMARESEKVKQEAIARMHEPTALAPTPTAPAQAAPQPQTVGPNPYDVFASQSPVYNPYPTDINQAVIQPINDPAHAYVPPAPDPAANTSDKPLSPDIMSLANNPDLSIETIAREANRIQKKEDDLQEEVVISLR